MGSEIIESAHIFLNFFNFFTDKTFSLYLFYGDVQRALLWKIFQNFFFHISVGDSLSEFKRWFSKTSSKIHPSTFQVGTEIMRFGVIFINFFKCFPLPSLWGRKTTILTTNFESFSIFHAHKEKSPNQPTLSCQSIKASLLFYLLSLCKWSQSKFHHV